MTATDPSPSHGAVLDIDLGAIIENWRALAARHGAPTAAVVKADAYGLGAARVAPALLAAGCQHFFVAHLGEALALRPLLPGALLAVLNGLPAGTEDEYVARDLLPVLGSLAEVARWRQAAARAGRKLPALLHVDTGMNRLGLDPTEVARLAAEPALLDGIDLRYVMTHLVSAECPDDPVNETQRARFAAACAALPPAPRSLANSSGIFLGYASDLARPGAALYGINPTPGAPNPMRCALRLRGLVLQVRSIGVGERVGYNGIWQAPRPSRIATVSIGYADGYPRALSNDGSAIFDGRAVPLVGRVSMDLTTFDVTDAPGVAPGTWAELIGPDLPPDAVARAAGMSAYELLTALGPRYRRVYRA